MSVIPRELDYTPEHAIDGKDHLSELDRVADDEKLRDAQRTNKILTDALAAHTKLTTEIANLVSKANNVIARDAVQPKLMEHSGEVVSDQKTGAKELADAGDKVKKVLTKADHNDANNGNGAAKESKFSKLAAGASVLVGLMPFMQSVFQIFVKAANGTLTAADLADTADQAAILALVQKWAAESDADYWKDFADFYQVHNAALQVGSTVGVLTRADPTSADLVLILNMTAVMNPVSLTQPFTWTSAKEQADTVAALAKTYDPTSLATKAKFIVSLADIKVRNQGVPRGIQARLGCMAVAGVIVP